MIKVAKPALALVSFVATAILVICLYVSALNYEYPQNLNKAVFYPFLISFLISFSISLYLLTKIYNTRLDSRITPWLLKHPIIVRVISYLFIPVFSLSWHVCFVLVFINRFQNEEHTHVWFPPSFYVTEFLISLIAFFSIFFWYRLIWRHYSHVFFIILFTVNLVLLCYDIKWAVSGVK